MNLNSVKYILNRFIFGRKTLLARSNHFGLELHVKSEDVVGRHLYKYGSHEPAITTFLKEYLKFEDDDIAFDIGANIGWYSLLLDKIIGNKKVDVFAFEPDQTNFGLLQKNIQQNSCKHVHPVQRAVADVEDTLKLHLYNKTNLGRHSLLAIHEGDTVDVKTIILDKFLESQDLADRTPRFIKIDIEGFELMALRGATQILSRCPMVMLEYSPAYMRIASIDPNDLIDLMFSLGFSANILNDNKLTSMNSNDLNNINHQVDLFWLKP